MFRKKDTGDSRQLLEDIDLTILVHGDKTLMGQFKLKETNLFEFAGENLTTDGFN